MESLVETFHIDLKLLIAQAVNFAIVFSILYFFALKPLVRVMRERTKKIEKSLADAEKVEKKVAETKAEYEKKMAEAKKRANETIEAAKETGEKKRQEMIDKAKIEIGQIINDEKAKIQSEKAKTLKEIKKEVADLVAASVEKVLGKKLDREEDKELIERTIKQK